MSDMMMFGSPWGKDENSPVLRGDAWGEWAEILHENAPELVEHLKPEEWEWGMIGDNTLCAHHWAQKMEGLGVVRQAALRYVRDRFVPDGTL